MPIYKRKGKQGISYQIAYQVNGKRVKENIGRDRKLAQIVLGKRLTEIAEGKYLDKDKVEKIRFEDFMDEYLQLHCKQKHKATSERDDIYYANVLKRHFSGKFLYEITPLDIEKFTSSLKKSRSVATVNRYIAFLKSFFNRAIEWGKTKNNPMTHIKQSKENNKRTRFLEEDEIKRLLENTSGALKSIIILALNTGMRQGEIFALKWRDIDYRRGIIHLIDTKSGEGRQIPMNDEVKQVFIQTHKHNESPHIFHNRYNTGSLKRDVSLAVIGKGPHFSHIASQRARDKLSQCSS